MRGVRWSTHGGGGGGGGGGLVGGPVLGCEIVSLHCTVRTCFDPTHDRPIWKNHQGVLFRYALKPLLQNGSSSSKLTLTRSPILQTYAPPMLPWQCAEVLPEVVGQSGSRLGRGQIHGPMDVQNLVEEKKLSIRFKVYIILTFLKKSPIIFIFDQNYKKNITIIYSIK